MKLFILLLSLSSLSFAEGEWKIIAESENCQQKIQVFGKEGEKYVLVQKGTEQIKLFSEDGSAYKKESPSSTIFKSVDYKFTNPAIMEANPPKLQILKGQNKQACRMVLK